MKKLLLLPILVAMLAASTQSSPWVKTQTPAPLLPEIKAPVEEHIPKISEGVKSTFTPLVYGNATKVTFSNGIAFDTKELGKNGEPVLPEQLTYNAGDTKYFIVKFNGPIYQEQREWLESIGQIHFYVPHYGFVCTIEDPSTVEIVRSNVNVEWVGIYQPAYKTSSLFDRVGEEHKTTILLFMDADISDALSEITSVTSNSDFTVSDNGINKMISGKINKKDLDAISHMTGVYWIEPYIQPEFYNQQYQWVVQTGYRASVPPGNDLVSRRIWGMGIVGQGEIINNCDTGINTAHYQHRSNSAQINTWGYYPTHNAIVAYDSGAPSGIVFGDGGSYHGTHTSGTIAGNDTVLGTSYYDGIAKYARLYFNDLSPNDNTLTLFGDLNDLYIRSYNKYYPPTRAYLSSNSWGAAVSGEYNGNSQAVDQFMWGHKDFLLFYSNGNSAGSGTVGSPATAKNCVSVGGTRNSTSCRTYYTTTSRGPCQDGRRKPTLCTPGMSITSSTTGTTGYSSMSGTSMSSPGACASGALVRQYLREGWYPTGAANAADAMSFISASLVKAMLINSCDNDITGYTVPDNNIGWGRIDLDSVLFFNGDARKLLLAEQLIGILTGEQVDYHFNIPSGATHLKIALVWTDYPGNPAVTPNIVNDLDLSAYIGGTYYRGNQYSAGQSQANPAGRDSINVEECIRVNNPTAGDWRVTIQGRNVAIGPQPFSLVVNYTAPTVAGFIGLHKPVYRANDFVTDTVQIRVEDTDYGAAGTLDSVRVVLRSALLETQPETLYCRELANNAYVFTGTFPLLFHKPVHRDGRLSVCQDDTIYATYVDASPPYTSTTWAGVDANYFLISDVHCENIGAFSAEVCWTTNENTSSKVYYGTDSSSLSLVAGSDTPYVVPHNVRLGSLSSKTRYFYDVESKDFRGNAVRDNNGGLHYSFTTEASAGIDILVILADGLDPSTPTGQPLPDLSNRFRRAMETGGWTYTYWETSDNGGAVPARNIIKNYKATFVVYEDEYPPFFPAQQETIRRYEEFGGRIAFASHDVLWHSWANSSNPGYDTLWCKNYMQTRYKYDLTPIGTYPMYGVSGDPITGPYAASPVSYTAHRDGAVADSLEPLNNPPNGWDTGSAAGIWLFNSATGGRIGSRWESNNTHGTPGDGVWGGYRTRTIMNAFSITQMDTTRLPGILNNEFIWLIGHDHPDVTLTSPVGGNTYNSSPINIAWTATAYGGALIDSTWIEYSPDAGQTWFLITSGTGMTSPYPWNVSTLTNGARYQVRVTVSDRNVYPSMKGSAATTNFTISITGNDFIGPKVLPMSIAVQTNPKIVTPASLLLPFSAVVNDSLTGLSNINAAEWSLGSTPVAPGSGDAMLPQDGSWNAIQEGVVDTFVCTYSLGNTDICTLWVRGRDARNNWGPAVMRTFTVVDGFIVIGISEDGRLIPLHFALCNPMPNPFSRTVAIRFGVPRTCQASLKIYNTAGQLVKTMVDGVVEPGMHDMIWNGTDNQNRHVSAGIYFYELVADDFSSTRKMVFVR